MPQGSEEIRLRKYKVYVLLHTCFVAFLAIMALIIGSRGSPVPYPKILAPYWAGFFNLLISVIAFVSFFVANLEIRLAMIILHNMGAIVAGGGLIVVTAIDVGKNYYFGEGIYSVVDTRPALLVIGGLLFLLDFIFVFVCGFSGEHFKQEITVRKILFEEQVAKVIDLREIDRVMF